MRLFEYSSKQMQVQFNLENQVFQGFSYSPNSYFNKVSDFVIISVTNRILPPFIDPNLTFLAALLREVPDRIIFNIRKQNHRQYLKILMSPLTKTQKYALGSRHLHRQRHSVLVMKDLYVEGRTVRQRPLLSSAFGILSF